MKKIGVGIIGVAPGRSWAAISHIPALRALPDYEIVALSTTRQESADAAAQQLGVPAAYDNHAALIANPDVDLVVVTVKVPHHYELVTAALDAGKHVYCEWPLGNGLAEAEKMADHARRTGVHAVVGLQARSSPTFQYLRDLIRDGYVGELLSTSFIGSGMSWGPVTEQANAYNANKANGATMATIAFGHFMEGLCTVLGEVREVTGVQTRRRTRCTILETGAEIPLTADDQLAVAGLLDGGAVFSVHYRAGMTRGGTGMLWEINGTDGDIQVTSIGGQTQLLELSIKGARGDQMAMEALPVPASYHHVAVSLDPGASLADHGQASVGGDVPVGMSAVVGNVAEAYQLLARDIRDGTHLCPTFDDAVRRHRLLAAVEKAAETGVRQTLAG